MGREPVEAFQQPMGSRWGVQRRLHQTGKTGARGTAAVWLQQRPTVAPAEPSAATSATEPRVGSTAFACEGAAQGNPVWT